MGVFTTAGKNALMDQLEGLGWHYAPFDGDPAGAGTEVSSSTTEGRQAVNATLAAAASGDVATDADIVWTNNSGGSLTISHIAFYDAASGGNLVASTALTASVTLADGETVTIASGAALFDTSDPV